MEHGLLLDNLLDLAHAPFTHTSTFAKGWSVPRFVFHLSTHSYFIVLLISKMFRKNLSEISLHNQETSIVVKCGITSFSDPRFDRDK